MSSTLLLVRLFRQQVYYSTCLSTQAILTEVSLALPAKSLLTFSRGKYVKEETNLKTPGVVSPDPVTQAIYVG